MAVTARTAPRSPIECVYKYRRRGAKLYIGNIQAARDVSTLRSHGISRIVNCQVRRPEHFFEADPSFMYMRFPIAKWAEVSGVDRSAGVLEFFRPLFEFVDSALEQGHCVLIHCETGDHRAGAAGVAALMHLTGGSCQKALEDVRRRRPAVEVVLHFTELLRRLDRAMGHEGGEPAVRAPLSSQPPRLTL